MSKNSSYIYILFPFALILIVAHSSSSSSDTLSYIIPICPNFNDRFFFFFLWCIIWNPVSKINTTFSSSLTPTKILWNQFNLALGLALEPKNLLSQHQTCHRLRSAYPKYVQHNHLKHHLELFLREHNSKGMRKVLK